MKLGAHLGGSDGGPPAGLLRPLVMGVNRKRARDVEYEKRNATTDERGIYYLDMSREEQVTECTLSGPDII